MDRWPVTRTSEDPRESAISSPPCTKSPFAHGRGYRAVLKEERDNAFAPPRIAETRVLAIGAGTTEATLYPGVVPRAPTAVILPAMGVPARSYARFARVLNLHGLNAVTIDLRGVGTSSRRASSEEDWGYLDLVDQETHAAVAVARAMSPAAPIFFVGHSLGGHLALLYLARHAADGIAGAFLAASGSPYVRAYKGSMRLVVGGLALAIGWSVGHWGFWPGDRFRFAGVQPRRLMSEWKAFAQTGQLVTARNEGWHAEAALRSVRAPIVALAMQGDRYVPVRSVEHLCAKTSGVVWHERVGSAAARRAPGHFGWLREPESTVCAMAANLARLGISRLPA